MCVAGRCDEVSVELRDVLAEKRREVARRVEELQFLDQRLGTSPASWAEARPLGH